MKPFEPCCAVFIEENDMAGEQLGFGFNEPEGRPKESKDPRLLEIRPVSNRLHELAQKGVHIGTSSWKYEGWLGQVYDPAKYGYRGKFNKTRFERECLQEYARVFPTVGGDFSFYQFPSDDYWRRLFDQVPDGFLFGLKVPEDITVERFPKLPRYGQRAGEVNQGFLDAAMLQDRFLGPLEPYGEKIGVLIFEFGTMYRGLMSEVEDFVQALDAFLAKLPTDRFRFAVEVRNRNFLDGGGEYLACLREHSIAHCLNSWTRMPPIGEQLKIDNIITARHVAARFLLRPGRMYQQAVDLFSPYEKVQEPYPEGRSAMLDLIERCLADQNMLFAYVNNRFEGNAVGTIEAVLNQLE
ncbi:MAG: DUF72 domain-containing protein [Phycisphaerales bacterium]|nr:MAG: DUF72 domain-containing protein [Phycisphaerales bacterium]